MIYFTADQHFDHTAIIEYCNRPFPNIKYMERALVKNFNSIVEEKDTTYHIGDFSLHSEASKYRVKLILDKLNGTHILILGNHDQLKPFSYVEMGFQSVHTYLNVFGYNLAHDPALGCIKPNDIWLCGHIHNLFKTIGNVVNVGVDVWDFKPVSLDQVNTLFE